MQTLEMNVPTAVLLVVVLVLFAFALRRAARVFSGRKDSPRARRGRGRGSGPEGRADPPEGL